MFMLQFKVTLDDRQSKTFGLYRFGSQYNSRVWHFMQCSSSYSKITVELVAGKRSCKPEDVVRVAARAGDTLRIVDNKQMAIESFGVVGCAHKWSGNMEAYLGTRGTVLSADQFTVTIQHHDGSFHDTTQLVWGHSAVCRLSSTDVDAMTVRYFGICCTTEPFLLFL